MGTSSSYGGPVGGGSLLPDWAPDPPSEEPEDSEGEEDPEENVPEGEEQDHPQDESRPTWGQAKGSMTRYVNSGGANQDQFHKAASQSVSAQGGSRNAASASRAGRSSAVRIGGLLSAAAQEGEAGIEQFTGRSFVGEEADILLAQLVDETAPDSSDNEASAAWYAAVETLEELFEEYSVREEGLDVLEELNSESVGEVIERYVGRYIYNRLMQFLGQRLEDNAATSQEACRIEREIKGYVEERVSLERESRDWLAIDWGGSEGEQVVMDIFTEGYELIESWQ